MDVVQQPPSPGTHNSLYLRLFVGTFESTINGNRKVSVKATTYAAHPRPYLLNRRIFATPVQKAAIGR